MPRPLACVLSIVACACSSSGASSTPPAPVTASCNPNGPDASGGGNENACLFGIVGTSAFTASIQSREVFLFSTFPSTGQQALAMEPVAPDGTWAFGGLAAGSHYYVEVAIGFQGLAVPVGQTVGPFTVPETRGPVAVQVKPVQIDALESRPAGGLQKLQWARAHVFDPSSGIEIADTATVTITLGGVPTTLPWDANAGAYFLELSPPAPAQASYTVTTSDPSSGQGSHTWQLVADPPSFDGRIVSPGPGAFVAVDQDLDVTWTSEPDADGESVEIFAQEPDAGGYIATYPPAGGVPDNGSDITAQTVPAQYLTTGGPYLVNVAYFKSNCPVAADGCLSAAAVAAIAFNVGDGGADAEAE